MKQVIVIIALFGLANCGLNSFYQPINQRILRSYPSTYGQYYRPSAQHGNSYGSYSGVRAPYYPHGYQQIPILRLEDNKNSDGTYSYAYETGNGIAAQEQGDGRGGTRAQGGFSYTSPEGLPVELQYTADENGFRPQGSHVPQIPEAIQKSIAKNLADEARGIVDDGHYRPGPGEKYGVSQGYDSHSQYTPHQFHFQRYVPQKQYGYPLNVGYKF